MQVNVTYSQTITVEVFDDDSIEVMLDKIKNSIDEQYYPSFYPKNHKYLQFFIDCCPEKPELSERFI